MNVIYEEKVLPIESFKDTCLSPIPHYHKELEIVYIVNGSATAHADNHCYNLTNDDIFITFPKQIHHYKSTVGEYIITIFSPSSVYGLERLLFENVPANNVIKGDKLNNFSVYINEISNHKIKFSLTKNCGYINLLMSDILPLIDVVPVSSYNITTRKILDYCNNNYKNELSLQEISDELHLSKYYISHLINKNLNMSINEYINSLRIDEACNLLRTTDKKIADISEDVGFGSIRTFNRVFTKINKLSPCDYRQKSK